MAFSLIFLEAKSALWLFGFIILVGIASSIAMLGIFSCYLSLMYKRYSHIPSPRRSSFICGHIPCLINNSRPFHEIYYAWYKEAGPIFVVFFIIRVVVVTLNPDDVKALFMNPRHGKPKQIYAKFSMICGQRFLGGGLLSETDYEKWKPRRRALDPAFHKSFLRAQISKFDCCTQQLINSLKSLADEQYVVSMKEFLHDATSDIISQVAFSSDFCKQWNKDNLKLRQVPVNNKLHSIISHALKGIQKTLRTPFIFQLLHPMETKSYKEAARAIRRMGRVCILERIEVIKSGESFPNDLLTHMLEFARLHQDVGLEDLIDDFTTFYTAGQETTANMLCFSFILIHQHPQVLKRLREEIESVIEDKRELCADDLDKLHYMEQIFLETLRLYPPISGLNKVSPGSGTTLTLSGYHIPAGTLISVGCSLRHSYQCRLLPQSSWEPLVLVVKVPAGHRGIQDMASSVMCRMTQYFDNPMQFNPSRFDPDKERPSAFVYFPFGVGHRRCIGHHFAIMEAKVIMGKLLQNFEFAFPQGCTLIPVTVGVLQPQGDIPCTLRPLQQ